MRDICPNCEKECELEEVLTIEEVEVRGELIKVDVEFFKCMECNLEFENTRGQDSLVLAYKEYRHRHNMLEPKQIHEWRKQYGLTQKELGKLLGWGEVTLSRYENGALQMDSHDKILRLAMEPHNLLALIDEAPDALSDKKRERLLQELRSVDNESCSFERLFEERFADYSPDEFSGFRKLDIRKLFSAILFFSNDGQLKTKLNKLLFYADFKHFKEYSVSITGARYTHLQYGPVPDNYDYYFAELARGNILSVEETVLGDYTGFNCLANKEPDMELFEETERDVLSQVMSYFKDFGSAEIMKFSHEEEAYTSTVEKESLSYMHAKTLKI